MVVKGGKDVVGLWRMWKLRNVLWMGLGGDGVIDEDDKTYSGTGIAKVEANLNLSASYKGFDFSAVIGRLSHSRKVFRPSLRQGGANS